MAVQIAPNSLEHIGSEELSRLINLWRSLALTGQVEAKVIAQALASEQRHRSLAEAETATGSLTKQAWWEFWKPNKKFQNSK